MYHTECTARLQPRLLVLTVLSLAPDEFHRGTAGEQEKKEMKEKQFWRHGAAGGGSGCTIMPADVETGR